VALDAEHDAFIGPLHIYLLGNSNPMPR
jgi:hypothetical protein